MIQLRDIPVLFAVVRAGASWTFRSIGETLGLAPASVHRSLVRLAAVGLYTPSQRRVNAAVLDELVRHGLRFVDTRALGATQRGYPTAWAVEPLASEIWTDGSEPPVWPHADGPVRGASLAPAIPTAHELLNRAPELGTDLALVDAIRVGSARERGRAANTLAERLLEQLA